MLHCDLVVNTDLISQCFMCAAPCWQTFCFFTQLPRRRRRNIDFSCFLVWERKRVEIRWDENPTETLAVCGAQCRGCQLSVKSETRIVVSPEVTTIIYSTKIKTRGHFFLSLLVNNWDWSAAGYRKCHKWEGLWLNSGSASLEVQVLCFWLGPSEDPAENNVPIGRSSLCRISCSRHRRSLDATTLPPANPANWSTSGLIQEEKVGGLEIMDTWVETERKL